MKKLVLIFVGIILAIIYLSVFSNLNFGFFKPNILLIYVLLISLNTDSRTTYIVSFFVGFFTDILFGALFGVNVVLFPALSFISRKIIEVLNEKRIFTKIIIFATSSVIYTFSLYMVDVLRYVKDDYGLFFAVLIKSIISNVVLGLVLAKLFESVIRRYDKNWW